MENSTQELKVESVSAITATAVEINITALTADNEALEVEVKDGKGNVVATKPVAVSAGETTVTVEFVTAVKAADLVGVWTVNGTAYDLDLAKKIADIVGAQTELPLYNALTAAGIKNVDADLIDKYLDAIGEAEGLTSLEAIQAVIDKVNTGSVSAAEAEALVEAIAGASNVVNFANLISENFERVNTEWNAEYLAAVGSYSVNTVGTVFETIADKDGVTATNAADLLEEIQAAIDTVNLKAVATEWAKVEATIDTTKFAAVRTLIDTYKVAPEEGAVDVYGYFTDVLDYQTAIAAVTTASTNSQLTNALNKLDADLKKYTEKYAGKTITVDTTSITGFKGGLDSFDIKVARTDSASLTEYRKAIQAETVVGNKNQAKDIQAIITIENGKKLNTLVKAVEDADKAITTPATATPAQNKALLDAIKAVVAYDPVTFKDVVVVDSRVEGYATQINSSVTLTAGALKTALDNANTNSLTSAFDALETANADTKDKVLAGLKNNELALTGVIDANIDAYNNDKALFNTAVTAQANDTGAKKIAALNKAVAQVNALVAINKATTATEVQANLGVLDLTGYLDVPTADRDLVAAGVLKARNAETTTLAKQFDNVGEAQSKGNDVVSAVTGNLTAINNIAPSTTLSAIAALLEKTGHTAFTADGSVSEEEVTIAEAFKASLVFEGTALKTPFSSQKAVRDLIDAALAN